MAFTLPRTANFGNAYASLNTVGYRLEAPLGTVVRARTTTGVTHVGQGQYAVNIEFPDGFEGYIIWDTASGSGIVLVDYVAQDELAGEPGAGASADSIWNHASRTLTSFGTLVEDIVSAATTRIVAALGGAAAFRAASAPTVYAGSGSPTRREIQRGVALRLRQYAGSDFETNPFLLDDLTSEIADEVARRTFCYYRAFVADLKSGTANYSTPQAAPGAQEMFYVDEVRIIAADGTRHLLDQRTLDWIQFEATAWREEGESGTPTVWDYHEPCITLYPTPNYDKTEGLLMAGYCIPGGMWGDPDSECPLPARAVPTIKAGVAYRYLLTLPPTAKEAWAMREEWRREYEDGVARLHEDVLRQIEQGRRRPIRVL